MGEYHLEHEQNRACLHTLISVTTLFYFAMLSCKDRKKKTRNNHTQHQSPVKKLVKSSETVMKIVVENS